MLMGVVVRLDSNAERFLTSARMIIRLSLEVSSSVLSTKDCSLTNSSFTLWVVVRVSLIQQLRHQALVTSKENW